MSLFSHAEKKLHPIEPVHLVRIQVYMTFMALDEHRQEEPYILVMDAVATHFGDNPHLSSPSRSYRGGHKLVPFIKTMGPLLFHHAYGHSPRRYLFDRYNPTPMPVPVSSRLHLPPAFNRV